MKNINTLACAAMMLCVAACNSGSVYVPVPNIDITQGGQPLAANGNVMGNGNTTDSNNAGADLSQTPLLAPTFTPSIDGNVFTPQAVFYAAGQDPQNQPVLMLVVSDQNNLCDTLTQGHVLPAASSQLAVYLYSVQASGFAAPATSARSYAVFDSSVPGSDLSGHPSLNIPTDAGSYVSGMFTRFDPMCTSFARHLLSAGTVDITAVDVGSGKAAGSFGMQLDDGASLSAGGTFVAQACPALLQINQRTGCMLTP